MGLISAKTTTCWSSWVMNCPEKGKRGYKLFILGIKKCFSQKNRIISQCHNYEWLFEIQNKINKEKFIKHLNKVPTKFWKFHLLDKKNL